MNVPYLILASLLSLVGLQQDKAINTVDDTDKKKDLAPRVIQ